MDVRVHLDFETACELDIRKSGLRRYVSHETFKVILTAWAVEDGSIWQTEELTSPLFLDWEDPSITWHAFNAPFERAVLASQGIAIPLERWRCTMAHAYARGFSGRLDKVGAQVGIPQDQRKLKDGGRLIGKFCKPRRPSRKDPSTWWTKANAPEDWERFCLYNRQDVAAERAIWHRLNEYSWAPEEQALWEWDQQVNAHGVPVDLALVENAIASADRQSAESARACKELTDGIAPSQVGKLLEWCQARGYDRETLSKKDVESWLKNC